MVARSVRDAEVVGSNPASPTNDLAYNNNVMIALVATVFIIFLLLCTSELLWRRRNVHPEYSRKFVHILVGSFVAFWPFFLTRPLIALLSGAFVAVVVISNHFNVFRTIHSVQRPTWGEIFFALAVGSLAYVAHSPWIYAAALLHMSLADGLAAIVGTKFGKKNRYLVFGHPKSAVGSLTFFVVALAVLAMYSSVVHTDFSVSFVAIAVGATLVENVGIRGLDNILVPLLVAVVLNVLR